MRQHPITGIAIRCTNHRSVRTISLLTCVVNLMWALATVPTAHGQELSDVQQSWLAKAEKHKKAGWTYLHIEGGPRERGFQYGYLLANEIAVGIKATRTEWEFQSAMTWAWLLKQATKMFERKIDKENLAELDGIVEGMNAAGVSTSRAEIVTYNGYYELAWYWWPKELNKFKEGKLKITKQSCSSFIATGSLTAGGGVVLAHNSMQGYQGALPHVIIDIMPDKGHRILMQAYPGWIHSGTDFFVTDAGLVGSETTIGWFEGFDPKGIPEFSRMRRATQDADSIGEWCAIMKKGNNGGYANAWLLGDVNTGEIARLELGLKFIGFERKHDGYFIGSNIAEDPKILRFETNTPDTDIRGSIVARRVRWKQLMAQYAGKIDIEAAKTFEADHFDAYRGEDRPGNRSLCAHADLEHEPVGPWYIPNDPGGTIDAKVVDTKMAKKMSFAARWGSACGTPFDADKFLTDQPQFEWMKDILQSRPSEPWTEFVAGEKE